MSAISFQRGKNRNLHLDWVDVHQVFVTLDGWLLSRTLDDVPDCNPETKSSVHTNYTMNGLWGIRACIILLPWPASYQAGPLDNRNILWRFDMASFSFSSHPTTSGKWQHLAAVTTTQTIVSVYVQRRYCWRLTGRSFQMDLLNFPGQLLNN